MTKAIGFGLKIPNIYYDAKDFINNPSLKNGIELGLDATQFVPSLTKFVGGNILSMPGMIDDYVAAAGRDGLEDIQGVKKKVQGKKTTTKKK